MIFADMAGEVFIKSDEALGNGHGVCIGNHVDSWANFFWGFFALFGFGLFMFLSQSVALTDIYRYIHIRQQMTFLW